MQLKPDMERHLKELLDLKKPVIPPNYDKTTVETDLDPDYGIGVRARGLDHLRFVSCGAVYSAPSFSKFDSEINLCSQDGFHVL